MQSQRQKKQQRKLTISKLDITDSSLSTRAFFSEENEEDGHDNQSIDFDFTNAINHINLKRETDFDFIPVLQHKS